MFIVGLIILIVGIVAYATLKKSNRKPESFGALILSIVGGVVMALQVFTVVPAGTVGVVDFLGMVNDNTLKPGVNLVNPLAKVEKFSIKTQELKEVMKVPSKEGLTIELEISLLFRLNSDQANEIYKTVGPNYPNIILIPQFRSVVRGVTSKYEAKALYTASREKLASEIVTELEGLVGPRGILIEAAPMRQIELPERIVTAIEEKLQAEQESQRMQFVLNKEKQEAERKSIEAKGIADFQTIVSEGINEQLLKWKGIEATEKLANSTNAKIIVIGSGKDGLPIILGGDK